MTTNDLKLARDGWLSYGTQPKTTRTTFGTVLGRDANGHTYISDGRRGAIEYAPDTTTPAGA